MPVKKRASQNSTNSKPFNISEEISNTQKREKYGEKIIHVSWSQTILAFIAIVFIPLFIYQCQICVEFNEAKFLLPKFLGPASISSQFKNDILNRLYENAIPTRFTSLVFICQLTQQALLFKIGPGTTGYGKILKDGNRLLYKYNGQFAFFLTSILAIILHLTKVFSLTVFYDYYAQFMTLANINCFVVIGAIYIYAIFKKPCQNRPTNSIIYNFFMGIVLNPGAKSGFDIKYFYELRPGIMLWQFTTLGIAAKMYDDYGTVSTPMILICFFHLCFINACYKGEQCVPQTIDIVYENFGQMLMMLDMVMVPFIFPLQTYCLYKMGPVEQSKLYTFGIALMHILGYWMFDTANSQKDYFRESECGAEEINKGFPRLIQDRLENPEYLPTEYGSKLLISGQQKYARHMNYTGDIMMSQAQGLICGTNSYFPFAYTTYLTPLLLHRERRDDRNCKEKYGKDQDKYCSLVPYRFIPFIY